MTRFSFEDKWDALMEAHNKSVKEYNEKKANEPKPATLQERFESICKDTQRK